MKARKTKCIWIASFTTVSLFVGCSFQPWKATTPMKADFPEAPVVRPFYDDYWLLLEDLTFVAIRDSDGKEFKVTIPAGFVTDLASIPIGLNLIYDKTGRYSSAGILHDYLYWIQTCDRNTSDRLIKEGLKATGSKYVTRNSIKIGVKWFGWAAWNRNAKSRAKKDERYVPNAFRQFPSKTKWDEYKIQFDNIEPPWGWLADEQDEATKDYCSIFVEKPSES